ncbi:hypothetical protein MKX03_001548 [Papaver bracteatum]|nr:hypothetical protein MKX03_001548 [Papaver bracteatum]
MRAKVQKKMLLKEQQLKELELRALAQKARSERAVGTTPPPSPPSVCVTTSDGITSDGGDQDMIGDYEKVKEKDGELPRESREEKEE